MVDYVIRNAIFVSQGLVHENVCDKYENRIGFDDGDFLIINFYSSGQDTHHLDTTTVWRPKGPTGGALLRRSMILKC